MREILLHLNVTLGYSYECRHQSLNDILMALAFMGPPFSFGSYFEIQ
jgi:hypothetical protein